ncbi:MAG TPA: glutaredoxin family protein [Candidatus Dormibacteraeota bacterium]|jgi:glutaredoxin|nr:glutaredoxin family protein [Candidatus Dormibacteraeota bacterium]
MAPLVVELLTRQDCGLCRRARAALDQVARERPLEIEERDIDADEALLREFHIRVPVVRLQGTVLCEGVVTADDVRATLRLAAGEAGR